MISILASRVGRDPGKAYTIKGVLIFQSSRPGWDATGGSCTPYHRRGNFNPRVPGGTRLFPVEQDTKTGNISILASRVGRDISQIQPSRSFIDFNPRVPGGTRLYSSVSRGNLSTFQSSRPGWDATTFLHRYADPS